MFARSSEVPRPAWLPWLRRSGCCCLRLDQHTGQVLLQGAGEDSTTAPCVQRQRTQCCWDTLAFCCGCTWGKLHPRKGEMWCQFSHLSADMTLFVHRDPMCGVSVGEKRECSSAPRLGSVRATQENCSVCNL